MSKKTVTSITNREIDFSQWYTDIVKKAELIEYSNVKGCIYFKPNGYGIWENIQKIVDSKFKNLGHENVYLPMFIPESLLQKEADHIEGFAPEVAYVTQVGNEVLEERLVVRPTSEVLFCELYKSVLESHRDLPKLYNQWCSVVRWEKTTRPFLRTSEFLWQEGHTVHDSAKEAKAHTLTMLDVYVDLFENYLAVPVIKGIKTEKEKFAGANSTYTIEALMFDGKALQCGTSHFLGNSFAKAFDVTYTDKNNKLKSPYQTSYGISTRSIGSIIMVHGDNNGLVLPPKIAPTQIIIVPIRQNKEIVQEKSLQIKEVLSKLFSVKLDLSDKTPGWKFNEYEMKGIPLRIEIGPKDIENNSCILARRDTGEKTTVSLDNIENTVSNMLDSIQKNMFETARKRRDENIREAHTFDEFTNIIETKQGFVKAMWCGDVACEEKIKEITTASSRCIPFGSSKINDKCVCCGKDATKAVIWGKAY